MSHQHLTFHQNPVVTDYRLRVPTTITHLALIGLLVFVAALIVNSTVPSLSRAAVVIAILALIVAVPTGFLWIAVKTMQGARNHMRDAIINRVHWHGNERVLDVGTGSGILLIACAKRLKKEGRAVGIDIYDPHAGGGTAEIFWKNVHGESVQDHVELHNMDARQMTFENGSFDVIVSSFAMHHMGGKAARERVLNEMVRVLKPGGKVLIYDVSGIIDDCAPVLQSQLSNVRSEGRLFKLLTCEKR